MKTFKKIETVNYLFEVFYEYVRHCKGLTSVECKTVTFLKKKGTRVTMKELADQLGFSTSRATRVVDKLVAKKFIKREQCENDRRLCYVKLRDEIIEDMEEKKRLRSKADFLSELSPEDKQIVDKGLDLIIQEFERVFKLYNIPYNKPKFKKDEEE